jgi:putative flippase GtrA
VTASGLTVSTVPSPDSRERGYVLRPIHVGSELTRQILANRRLRFLLAGGVNTGFGFLCFVFYQHTVGHAWGYMWTLLLSHITSVLFAFATHRLFVFRVTGNLLMDLWRFESVYLTALGVNAVLLPLLVEAAGLSVLAAQAVITVLNVVLSWLGHSRFSFRRAPGVA